MAFQNKLIVRYSKSDLKVSFDLTGKKIPCVIEKDGFICQAKKDEVTGKIEISIRNKNQ